MIQGRAGPRGQGPGAGASDFAPARAPPQSELLLDQTSDFDVTAPEPVPLFDFDQSLPDSCD